MHLRKLFTGAYYPNGNTALSKTKGVIFLGKSFLAHFINFIFPLIEHSIKLASRSKKGRKKLRETHKTAMTVSSNRLGSDENVSLNSSRIPQFFEDSVLAKYFLDNNNLV